MPTPELKRDHNNQQVVKVSTRLKVQGLRAPNTGWSPDMVVIPFGTCQSLTIQTNQHQVKEFNNHSPKFSKHQKVDIFIRYFQQRIRKEISFFRKTYITLALTSAIKVERTKLGSSCHELEVYFLHSLRIKPSILSLGNVFDSTIKARARNVITHMNVDSLIYNNMQNK